MHKLLLSGALALSMTSCESTRPPEHIVIFMPQTLVTVVEPAHKAVGKIHPVPVDVFREIFKSGMTKN